MSKTAIEVSQCDHAGCSNNSLRHSIVTCDVCQQEFCEVHRVAVGNMGFKLDVCVICWPFVTKVLEESKPGLITTINQNMQQEKANGAQ